MKFSGKKGQGAMEYLMTYGWAIMVVMIVGVVLWQMGVFNLGGERTTATGFEKIKPLNPGDIIVRNNNISIVFTNVAGGTITIEDANISFSAPSGVVCGSNTGTGDAWVTPMGRATVQLSVDDVPIGQADTFQLDITGCALTSGTSYVADVSIVYTIEVGGFTRRSVETGTIRGKVI